MQVSGKIILTTLGVVAALGFGIWKADFRLSRNFSDETDPIRFVSYVDIWDITVQNTGPDADVVHFWLNYETGEVHCPMQSFMSSGERREIVNVCPEVRTAIFREKATVAVLTLQQYNNTNGKEVWTSEYLKLKESE